MSINNINASNPESKEATPTDSVKKVGSHGKLISKSFKLNPNKPNPAILQPLKLPTEVTPPHQPKKLPGDTKLVNGGDIADSGTQSKRPHPVLHNAATFEYSVAKQTL